MSFKIPNIPTTNATPPDYADFLELMCIANDGEYSIVNGTKKIAYGSDEIDNEGVESEDDRVYNKLQEALGEIDARKVRCNNRYPFATRQNSILLDPVCEEHDKLVYLYLLFATRNNMSRNKIKVTIDGTLLFEEISSLIIKNYWGDRAESFAFGTSSSGGFRAKIEEIIAKIKEGVKYKDPEETTHDEQDGGLDIVVWKSFSDKRKSKLIGFGQCKTGTEWRTSVALPLPEQFCQTYLSEMPYLNPVKIFFTAEVCIQNYEAHARKAGLFFDRCRLMDFLPKQLPVDMLTRVQRWTNQSIIDWKSGL